MGASLYSPELVDAICARLETGETLSDICRSSGMPGRTTVWEWERDPDKPNVSERIARAREIGFDAIAASCLAIADGPAQLQGNPCGSEDVQRDKLRIWSRLQLLAKWDPKRYGDKLALGGADDLPPMQTVTTVQLVGPSDHGAS